MATSITTVAQANAALQGYFRDYGVTEDDDAMDEMAPDMVAAVAGEITDKKVREDFCIQQIGFVPAAVRRLK